MSHTTPITIPEGWEIKVVDNVLLFVDLNKIASYTCPALQKIYNELDTLQQENIILRNTDTRAVIDKICEMEREVYILKLRLSGDY